MRARLRAAALIPVLIGCYTNRPTLGPPAPSNKVAVLLTDAGRAEGASRLGPGAFRVEGSLVAASDTAFVLSVSGIQPIRGEFVRWAGETLSVSRSYIAQTYERRLSAGRTAIVAGGAAGVIALAIATTNLLGFGGNDLTILPPPDGGQSQ